MLFVELSHPRTGGSVVRMSWEFLDPWLTVSRKDDLRKGVSQMRSSRRACDARSGSRTRAHAARPRSPPR